MPYREHPVPRALRGVVEAAWTVRVGPGDRVRRILPDGCVDLVWQPGLGPSVVGAMTTAQEVELPPGALATGVRLRPGAAGPLLGLDAGELADDRAGWAHGPAGDAPHLAALLRAVGAQREAAARPPDLIVRAAAQRLRREPGLALDRLAHDLGLGERHLRRRFGRAVGLGPKRFARIARLQRALTDAAPWAAVAAAHGFSDQAHLTREVRALTGLTPTALRAEGGRVRFVQDAAGPAREDGAMRFAWTIVYVPDVAASVDFYERAFGLRRRFVHESGTYAELDTGETRLAFAALELGDGNVPGGVRPPDPAAPPPPVEIALVDDDVPAAYARAVGAGATGVTEPTVKPWGQTVSWVRDPDGILVELATPVD